MKFNFKIQQYQTDAVDAVVRVFQGQGFHDKISYIRDRGKVKAEPYQMTLGMSDEELDVIDPLNDTGYKNEAVELSDEQLLHNIQALQSQNKTILSSLLPLSKIWGVAALILKWKPARAKPMSISRRCSS